MMPSFASVPSGAPGTPEPFKLEVAEAEIDKFRTLLQLSEIGPDTWWSNPRNGYHGVTRSWLENAKEEWLKFDWRKTESRVNALPNFTIAFPSDGQQYNVHFMALFSSKTDAIPVVLLHGWPGSFLEFLGVVELLVKKYTPDTLPWHIVVPSIPDYGLTMTKDAKAEMTISRAAAVMNELMKQLGFQSYVAQGGDVGSMLANELAQAFPECIAYHLNMPSLNMTPRDLQPDQATPDELAQLENSGRWRMSGIAYALEHGTRPATIGLALSSSPLAMLAWIGEKYLEWADDRQPLSTETILSHVSFYWFTKSYSTSLWPYRQLAQLLVGQAPPAGLVSREPSQKPLGYSSFPKEMSVVPKKWLETTYPNLAFFKRHEVGGHFAALEQPQAFLADVEEFLAIVRDRKRS